MGQTKDFKYWAVERKVIQHFDNKATIARIYV